MAHHIVTAAGADRTPPELLAPAERARSVLAAHGGARCRCWAGFTLETLTLFGLPFQRSILEAH